MAATFAQALEAAWYRPGVSWAMLLWPLSVIFGAVTGLRRWVYGSGLLRRFKAPCPVLVIGNITVGGTGKTPTVIALSRALAARGIRIGVVSGGYGGTQRRTVTRIRGDSDPAAVGDEAVLLATRVPGPVVVGAQRAAAVRRLLVESPSLQLVLCDDGLQHYALQRDLEIVTIDAGRGLGNGLLLPAGPLREPRRRLAGVYQVLERGGDDPRTALAYLPRALRRVDGIEERHIENHRLPASVHAVAGVGNPEPFFALLRTLGFRIREHRFADHHAFVQGDLAALSDRPVIMTEKDAVKCRRFAGANHWALVVDAQLPEGLVDGVVKRLALRESP